MLVGSDSTGEASVYSNRLTSSLAGEATISGLWPVAPAAATGGISVIRPAEVKGSFPSFRDGRRLFWRGATARLSDKLLPVNDESIVKREFYSRVLEPTNAAVSGLRFASLGWSSASAAESMVPLGGCGTPNFMCGPACSTGLAACRCEQWRSDDCILIKKPHLWPQHAVQCRARRHTIRIVCRRVIVKA